MGDLKDIGSAHAVKMVGSSPTGTEQTPIASTDDRLNGENRKALPITRPVKYFTLPLLNGGSPDMAVDGSGTPVVFDVTPGAGKTFFIEKIVIELRDEGNLRLDEFGSGLALTNGVLVEVNSIGVSVMSVPITTNNNIISAADNILELDVFQGATLIIFELLFINPLTLNGDSGDFIKFTVRDNLTSIETFQASIRIWEVA